jgi:hypothetical protein
MLRRCKSATLPKKAHPCKLRRNVLGVEHLLPRAHALAPLAPPSPDAKHQQLCCPSVCAGTSDALLNLAAAWKKIDLVVLDAVPDMTL